MDAEATPHQHGFDRVALSNEMVRLYKEQFGLGPNKAHTYVEPDLIVVTLENTMTPAERNMVEAGAHHRVRESRLYFQYATEREFVGTVEQITGRNVRAYMSAIDTRADIAVEFFHLEPHS